ncbi:zinc finger SWIM domain-containing protein, partial [gut metagenome]
MWGNKWLDALANLDHENRLSRGRTYYRNGNIVSVTFDAESLTIEGVVDGNAYYPYEVSIGLQPMPADEKKKLVSAIASRPDLVAKLIDGQLDQEIAELADREGIALFPRSWREFRLSCTCPDTAVPCKHISAVYYAIVNSIDLDPMWVFYLRGVDLVKELKALQIDIEDAVRLTDPSWEDWRQLSEDLEGVRPVDFPQLPLFTVSSLAEKLAHLVAMNGGYKKELTRNRLESHYKHVTAWADQQLEQAESQASNWNDWVSGLIDRDVVPVMTWEGGRPQLILIREKDQSTYRLSVGQSKKMLEALSRTTLQEAAAHSKQ